jgi:hypothetical protein
MLQMVPASALESSVKRSGKRRVRDEDCVPFGSPVSQKICSPAQEQHIWRLEDSCFKPSSKRQAYGVYGAKQHAIPWWSKRPGQEAARPQRDLSFGILSPTFQHQNISPRVIGEIASTSDNPSTPLRSMRSFHPDAAELAPELTAAEQRRVVQANTAKQQHLGLLLTSSDAPDSKIKVNLKSGESTRVEKFLEAEMSLGSIDVSRWQLSVRLATTLKGLKPLGGVSKR